MTLSPAASSSTPSSGAPLRVVVMAAGKGTRMKSRLPKVLHRLVGRPLVGHVIDTAKRLGAAQVVVITGHGAGQVEPAVRGLADQGQTQPVPDEALVRLGRPPARERPCGRVLVQTRSGVADLQHHDARDAVLGP